MAIKVLSLNSPVIYSLLRQAWEDGYDEGFGVGRVDDQTEWSDFEAWADCHIPGAQAALDHENGNT